MSRKGLRRLLAVRVPAAVVPYIGIGLVASATLPQTGRQWEEAPMVGIVSSFDEAWLREPLRYLVAVCAITVLVIACNAAMFGLARLGNSLAVNRQIPSLVGRLHPTYGTPVVLIVLGALLAAGLVLPTDLEFLAAIYAFGATLAFTLVHLSVIRLRFREPDRDRPYTIPFNLPLKRGKLPLTAVAGSIMAVVAFISVLFSHDAARWVGIGWLAVRRAALRDLPDRGRQAGVQARHGPGEWRSPAARSRRSTDRSSCPCSARRSTTTSCRPPGGSRATRTRTSARVAR